MSQEQINSSGMGGGDGGDWPKASIGNYKGVMLCNRPNEFGQQRRPERVGLEPFNSRVQPGEPLGWNPAVKLLPRTTKKKRDPNSILVRHRKFLRQLETQKMLEREEELAIQKEQEEKQLQFKIQAQKQRDRIKNLKRIEEAGKENQYIRQEQEQEQQDEAPPSEVKSTVTKENLAALNEMQKSYEKTAPQKSTKPKKNKKKAAVPAWAKTEAQQEEQKEAEIDELLEFAYGLDYEEYMEDYEVRQALAIIKDRVNEITKETDWKEKMAEEWNQANEAEEAQKRQLRQTDQTSEVRSTHSYNQSQVSRASKASYTSRISEVKRREAAKKQDWDASTTGEKKQATAEERMASKIASEVLRDNPKMRGVHSNTSIKQILEKEAKRQMEIAAKGGEYEGPVISTIVEKGGLKKADPSNLPYLHKNPAV